MSRHYIMFMNSKKFYKRNGDIDMTKRILIVFLCIVMVLSNNVVYASENDQMHIEEENNLSAGSTGGISSQNINIVNKLIEENKFTSIRGHGFAAERGNNLIDVYRGLDASIVGDNNVKNGADRLIINRDGTKTWIQDKYYLTARDGINACFDNGEFRYIDGEGNPMRIEVPSDQYDDAVKIMREKIEQGLIPGVTDPEEAVNLVKKGSLSYKQAVNTAKAGNIDSLKYDAKTGVVYATCAFGISALVDYTVCIMNGMATDEAIKTAALNGVKTGGTVFVTTVIAGQISKTGVMNVFVPSSEALTKALGSEFSDAIIKAYGDGTSVLKGTAKTQAAAKILRNQVLIETITIVVLSADDVADLFAGRISKEQLIKNISLVTVEAVGGSVGYVAGSSIGTYIAPGIGTNVGGVVGSIVIGSAAGYAGEKIISIFYEDDADKMLAIIDDEFTTLSEEYLINEDEADTIIECLQEKLTGEVLKDMFASENQNEFARKLMEPLFETQVAKREKIKAPTEAEMRQELKESLNGVVFIH